MIAAVEVVEDTDVVLLRLPPRDLSWFRNVGGCCIFLGTVLAGIFYALVAWIPPGGQPELDDFLIPSFVAGFGVLLLIVSFLGSHTEVRLDHQDLQITEYLGHFRWTRTCRLMSVRRLAIRHLYTMSRKESAPPPKPDDRAVLIIERRGHPELKFAQGYSRQQLLEFAAELAARCGEPTTSTSEPSQRIEVIEQDEATLFEERDIQPSESGVVCETHPDGVTLVVPPDGFWRIAGPTLITCLPICVMIVFRIWWIWLAFPNVDWFDGILVFVGLAILTAIGLHTRDRARRQSVFAVVGERLLVIEAGQFHNRRHEWERAELYDVRSGEPFGGKKGAKLFELQIWKRDGKKVPLLRGRTDAELRWMATVLRKALRLPLKREEIVEGTGAMQMTGEKF